jgi:plasmid stabilization system protein ParE
VTKKLVSIHPAALRDAESAIDWYRERSQRAAERFLDEVDHTVRRIEEQPAQFPRYELETRRAFLRRFPYFIVFRERGSDIEIVAIAHGRRRPGFWKDRVQ